MRGLSERLRAGGIGDAAGEARFLVLGLLGLARADLVLAGGEPIGPRGAACLAEAAARRLAGEPVARILGEWEFWGLTFRLSPETLVPRPDTETLVETALRLYPPLAPRILDLGTGSGCILVALLAERPGAFGVGLDRSHGALVTARANAEANGVGARAAFLRGDWCAALAGPFDLVVSNPPYIASPIIPTLDAAVRAHDPGAALDGGADGLDAYRAILAAARPGAGLVAPGGRLILEIGYDQAEAVDRLGRAAGWGPAERVRDLAGNPRVLAFGPA
ncbi:peptide chain release factor N(5)-glutamine methyltransferase [Methylobacterium sp. A54F]